jgi:two-component system OmpR family response regulator
MVTQGGGEPAVRILVVDDEAAIRNLVATVLRYEGFEVEEAASGREALAVAAASRPALVVLDIMLPDHDGLEVMRRLRRDGLDAGVVFLTAREETQDKVAGLELGADDYVTKPFSLEELVARVRAVLRRLEANRDARPERLAFADLELDEATHEVHRAGRPITLTATEFRLLRYFLLNPRRVLSKAQLLEHVWDYDVVGEGTVVETYISYLRRKLGAMGPPLLHTVRGVGYALRMPEPP